MANTENIEAKLCAYVDGELDPAGRAEIEAHLVANPQHRSLMDELMKQRDLLASLPRERAPEDLFEAMQNQLERSVLLDGDAPQQAVAGSINRWPQYFAVAAVLVLAIGLAAVIYFVLPNQNQQSQYAVSTPTTMPIYSTPADVVADAATAPLLARRDGDRVEAKGGSGGVIHETPAAPATPTATTPTVVATAQPDIFSKQGAPSQLTASGDVAAISNIFADHQLNDTLKNAPGVPDNSMVVVVNAGNPSAANEQIKQYFASNQIKWEPVAEPMPPPLDLSQSQVVMRSRLGETHMKLKGGDLGAGIGAGGGGAAPPTTVEARQEYALNDTAFQDQRQKHMASSGTEPAKADAAKEEKARSFATKDGGSGFGGYGRAAGAEASTGQQQQQRDADAFAESKSQANASQRPAPAAAAQSAAPSSPAPSQPKLGETEAGKPAESPLAAATPAPEMPAAPSAPPAEIDAAKRVAEIPPADQVALVPPPVTTAPSGEAQVHPPAAAIDETVALQQSMQQQSKQFDNSGQTTLFIARGVTRQQIHELNAVIVAQNRVSNYNRAGGTITPTTVPAAVASDLTLKQQQQPSPGAGLGGAYAMADKSPQQTPSRRLDELSKLATQPTASGISPAATPETSATTAPAENGLLNVDKKSLDVAATTSPSTAPAMAPTTAPATVAGTPTTQPATDEERLDVVFLVQSEAPVAVQTAAPNAAAIEPTTTPATTSSTAPTATSPASAPAAR